MSLQSLNWGTLSCFSHQLPSWHCLPNFRTLKGCGMWPLKKISPTAGFGDASARAEVSDPGAGRWALNLWIESMTKSRNLEIWKSTHYISLHIPELNWTNLYIYIYMQGYTMIYHVMKSPWYMYICIYIYTYEHVFFFQGSFILRQR